MFLSAVLVGLAGFVGCGRAHLIFAFRAKVILVHTEGAVVCFMWTHGAAAHGVLI